MENIDAPNLHLAVKFLKELRIQMVGGLPHYGNYGLFFRNDEITTGLMNNKKEIKINLLDGSFHYYDTENGNTFDITKPESPKTIHEFLQNLGFETSKLKLNSISLDQLHRYREFSILTNRYLELMRMRLKGQYTQVYLWGHNFDFDLVWFTGSRSSEGYDEQIDIGVTPGDGGHPAPYLYVTPRPFNDKIINSKLPIGKWVTEGWKGILVEWNELIVKPQNEIVDLIEALFNIGKKNFDN